MTSFISIRALERGVSIKCRVKIFYSFRCRLENHSVECRLGIITIFHAANKTLVPYCTGVKCRGEF